MAFCRAACRLRLHAKNTKNSPGRVGARPTAMTSNLKRASSTAAGHDVRRLRRSTRRSEFVPTNTTNFLPRVTTCSIMKCCVCIGITTTGYSEPWALCIVIA